MVAGIISKAKSTLRSGLCCIWSSSRKTASTIKRMSVHVERFTGRVTEYARFRERYEASIILPLLKEWCGLLPEWTIADIAAGTGMLSDVFLANGNRVIAVEPNAEMREVCTQLHEGAPQLAIVNGTAEVTGLPDASVQMVAVGRALHWFDLDAAMREFRRVLKPGGWVAVIAFGRMDTGTQANIAYENLFRPYTGGKDGTRASYPVYRQLEEVFAEGEFYQAEIPGVMELGWVELRGFTLSLSHSPLPESAEFGRFEIELRRFFDQYERNGKVTLATRYWINAGRFGAPTSEASDDAS